MYWFLHVHYYYMVTCVRLSFSTHVKLRRLYCSILLVLDWHLLRLEILLCCVCRKRKSRRWRQCLLAISAIERQTPWYDTCYRLVDGFVSDPHFTVCFATCSLQFNLFNSSQRKSQWKAGLKRWVLSPAWNWLRLMDGERRWSGSEFQTTGAAMKKLRLPSLAVLVDGRSPCSAERRPGRPELSTTV